MNWLLAVQVWAFVIFVVCVLDWTLQAVAKRLFPPSWGRKACTFVTGFRIAVVLFSTVPGRTRHLDFVKQVVMDDVAARNFNGGGSGLGAWLGTKVTDLAADLAVQTMRVEKYALISIGFIETDWGWSPVSVGFAGIVFRNFFIDVPTYETPQVNIELAKDAEGNCQVVLQNNDAANYAVSVSSYAGTPLCKFELEAQSFVRIQQEKKGLKNKIKKMITGDKSLVTISEPIEQSLNVGFKRGGRTLKRANVMLSNDAVKVHWSDPK